MVPDTKRQTLQSEVRSNVQAGSEVFTDSERFTNAVGFIVGKRLMYKDLTGKTLDLQTT